jgi:hypothetical protein
MLACGAGSRRSAARVVAQVRVRHGYKLLHSHSNRCGMERCGPLWLQRVQGSSSVATGSTGERQTAVHFCQGEFVNPCRLQMRPTAKASIGRLCAVGLAP